MNHTSVSHADAAREHLATAAAHTAALDRIYSAPEPAPGHLVANSHDKRRHALKAAEVNALLAIADELSRIGLAR
jgi:hypothetical protein